MEKIVLSDIADITKLAGFEFSEYFEYIEDGEIIAVRATNLKNGFLDLTDIRRISKTISEKLLRSKLYKYDIVMSSTGTIGECAQIRNDDSFHCAPNVCKISPKQDKVDPDFLFQVIRSSYFKKVVLNYAHGSTQPTISTATIRELPIDIPLDLPTQRKAAYLLSRFDRKIENGIAIIEQLENLALNCFIDTFEKNKKLNWKNGTISDLGEIVAGGTPSKARSEYYDANGIAWITPKDLADNKSKFIYKGQISISELGYKKSSAKLMPPGTVLFSSRAPIGYVAIAANDLTTNQGFKSVIPKKNIGTPYVYYFLKRNTSLIESVAGGSTFKEVSGGEMKKIPAVIPDDFSLKTFNDFCYPLFEQQRILEKEISLLETTRNMLFTKIMMNDIDLSNIQPLED